MAKKRETLVKTALAGTVLAAQLTPTLAQTKTQEKNLQKEIQKELKDNKYIVKKNETLFEISARFGLNENELVIINNLSDSYSIEEGMRLEIRPSEIKKKMKNYSKKQIAKRIFIKETRNEGIEETKEEQILNNFKETIANKKEKNTEKPVIEERVSKEEPKNDTPKAENENKKDNADSTPQQNSATNNTNTPDKNSGKDGVNQSNGADNVSVATPTRVNETPTNDQGKSTEESTPQNDPQRETEKPQQEEASVDRPIQIIPEEVSIEETTVSLEKSESNSEPDSKDDTNAEAVEFETNTQQNEGIDEETSEIEAVVGLENTKEEISVDKPVQIKPEEITPEAVPEEIIENTEFGQEINQETVDNETGESIPEVTVNELPTVHVEEMLNEQESSVAIVPDVVEPEIIPETIEPEVIPEIIEAEIIPEIVEELPNISIESEIGENNTEPISNESEKPIPENELPDNGFEIGPDGKLIFPTFNFDDDEIEENTYTGLNGKSEEYEVGEEVILEETIEETTVEEITTEKPEESIIIESEEKESVVKEDTTVELVNSEITERIANITEFEIIYEDDNTLPFGEEQLTQFGSKGQTIQIVEIQSYSDGSTIETVLEETVIQPTPEIIKRGTYMEDLKDETSDEIVEELQYIPYDTVSLYKEDLPVGETQIIPGQQGVKKVSYKNTYRNGYLIGTEEISSVITEEPVNEIIYVGTMENTVEEIVSEPSTYFLYEDEIIPSIVVYINSDDLFEGETQVLMEGQNGLKRNQYEVDQNGSKTLISSEVVQDVTNTVIAQGTKTKTVIENRTSQREIVSNYKEQIKYDNTKLAGEPDTIIQEGSNGIIVETIQETYENGVLKSSTVVSRDEMTQAQDRIISRPSGQPRVTEETETKTIPFSTEIRYDDTLKNGTEMIIQEGQDGIEKTVYQTKTFNGEVIFKGVVNQYVEQELKNKIILKGTKEKEITHTTKTVKVETPFKEVIQYTNELIKGETKISKPGVKGITERLITETYYDGVLVDTQTKDTVITEPVTQIKLMGTAVITNSTRTAKEEIPNSKVEYEIKYSAKLKEGEEKIEKAGTKSYYEIVYEDTLRNGKVVSTKEVSRKEIPGVKGVKLVGTGILTTTRRTVSEENKNSQINYEIRYSDKLKEGAEQITKIGTKSTYEIIYEDTLKDGKVISTKEVSRKEIPGIKGAKLVGTGIITTQRKTDKQEITGAKIEYEIKYSKVLEPGVEKIEKAGTKPYYEIVKEETYKDGKLISTKEVSRKTVPGTKGVKVIGEAKPKGDEIFETTFGYKPNTTDIDGREILSVDFKVKSSILALYEESDEAKYKKAKDSNYINMAVVKDKTGTWAAPVKMNRETLDRSNKQEYLNVEILNEEFLKLLNQERTSKGLKTVQYSPTLQKGTDVRALEQANIGNIRSNGMKHTRPDGTSYRTAFEYLPYSNNYIGENILGNNFDGNPYQLVSEKYWAEVFFNQWKNSPSHYKNMMNPDYKYSTVSIAFGNKNDYSGDMYNSVIGVQILSVANQK